MASAVRRGHSGQALGVEGAAGCQVVDLLNVDSEDLSACAVVMSGTRQASPGMHDNQNTGLGSGPSPRPPEGEEPEVLSGVRGLASAHVSAEGGTATPSRSGPSWLRCRSGREASDSRATCCVGSSLVGGWGIPQRIVAPRRRSKGSLNGHPTAGSTAVGCLVGRTHSVQVDAPVKTQAAHNPMPEWLRMRCGGRSEGTIRAAPVHPLLTTTTPPSLVARGWVGFVVRVSLPYRMRSGAGGPLPLRAATRW